MNVIVGAGTAAMRAAEAMREAGYGGRIVMVSAERKRPYEKPPLSKGFLLGTVSADELALRPADFFAKNEIDFESGRAAARLDAAERRVVLDDGTTLPFERLLVATGASPRVPALPGIGLGGVTTLRTLDDAEALRFGLRGCSRLVVVGAGLVGLEVASVARTLGKDVTVVERAAAPMARLLGGRSVATEIEKLHADHGVAFRFGRGPERFLGGDRVEAVVLDDGSRIPCELVLVAAGVQPEIGWLRSSGVALEDGIEVDERGETQVPGIFAAGDCARTFHRSFGRSLRLESYGNAFTMGGIAGTAMAGATPGPLALPGASSEQFGVRMQVVGLPGAAERFVIRGSREERSFVAYFLAGPRLVGAFAMNRPRELLEARKRLAAGGQVDERNLEVEGAPLA